MYWVRWSVYHAQVSPINKCHACGAATYSKVIQRNASGFMTPSGVYRCAGCKLLFTSIAEWRMGQPATDQAPDQQAIQNDHAAR